MAPSFPLDSYLLDQLKLRPFAVSPFVPFLVFIISWCRSFPVGHHSALLLGWYGSGPSTWSCPLLPIGPGVAHLVFSDQPQCVFASVWGAAVLTCPQERKGFISESRWQRLRVECVLSHCGCSSHWVHFQRALLGTLSDLCELSVLSIEKTC